MEQRGQPHTRRGRGDRVAARPSRETGGGIRKGGGARSRNQAQQTCVSRDLREVSGRRSWGLVVLLFDLPFELSQRLTAKSRVPPVNRIADPGFSQFSSVRPILHQRQHPPNVQSHEKAISDAARRQPQIPNANAARLRAPQLGLQRPLNVSCGCCSSDAADGVDHHKRTIRLGDLRGEDSPVNPHVISIRAIRQPTSALCSVHRGQRV